MALKLNRPNIDESQQPATNAETAVYLRYQSACSGKPKKLMN
nr:hypothetical protein [Escherichia coli]